ncbi:MAG: cytochrome c maturation protein CcmE [Pseudomonadota bacterium]
MRARTRRLYVFSIAAVLLICAALLVVFAVGRTANLFYEPADLAEVGLPDAGQRVKVGGFVEIGSLEFLADAEIRFSVVDGSTYRIPVSYTGIRPDLFREGSGVVATGYFTEADVFVATELLAKHDENYVPRELRDMDPGVT